MNSINRIVQRVFPSNPETGSFGSVDLNLWLARACGIYPTEDENSSKLSRIVLVIYSFLILITFNVLYLGFELYDFVLSWGDINAFSQNSCLTLAHVGGSCKLISLFLRTKDIQRALRLLRALPTKYVVSKNHRDMFFYGELENKLFFIVNTVVVSLTTFMGIAVLWISPAFYLERMFPYRVRLPTYMPILIKMIYMSGSVYILALQILAADYLNINLINQIRYQLKILNLSLEDLRRLSKTKEHTQAFQLLKTSIDHHRNVLELRRQVERIFTFPVMAQFLTSLLIFALTGFQATVRADIPGAMLTYFYSGCIFGELAIYCWFGNEIIEQSKTLSQMGYNSPWYEFNEIYRKTLLVFLINAQQPVGFTAGGFFDLSLSTFSKILSKSYTYIAILRQVYE